MWNDERGGNLLGSNSNIYLDQHIDTEGGCEGDGLHPPSVDAIGSPSWVFFNINGSSSEYGLHRKRPYCGDGLNIEEADML